MFNSVLKLDPVGQTSSRMGTKVSVLVLLRRGYCQGKINIKNHHVSSSMKIVKSVGETDVCGANGSQEPFSGLCSCDGLR